MFDFQSLQLRLFTIKSDLIKVRFDVLSEVLEVCPKTIINYVAKAHCSLSVLGKMRLITIPRAAKVKPVC